MGEGGTGTQSRKQHCVCRREKQVAPRSVIPDPDTLQLAPDTLPEEEELVLLKCGLRDIKKGLEQLNHVCAHQPAQKLGQDHFPQTVFCSRDTVTPWNERPRLSPPAWPIPAATGCMMRQVRARCAARASHPLGPVGSGRVPTRSTAAVTHLLTDCTLKWQHLGHAGLQ